MEKVLIHYNLLHTINGTNETNSVSEILDDYDIFILQPPFNLDLDNPQPTSDTPLFFEVLRPLKNKKIYYYIPLFGLSWGGGFGSGNLDVALTKVLNLALFYQNLSNGYNFNYSGYFLDEFGYDYFQNYHTRGEWEDYVRNVINGLHPKSLIVNAWFFGRDVLEYSLRGNPLIDASKDYVLSESILARHNSRYYRIYYTNSWLKWDFKILGCHTLDFSSYPIFEGFVEIQNELLKTKISNYYTIMSFLGLYGFGIMQSDYGATNNLVITPPKFKNYELNKNVNIYYKSFGNINYLIFENEHYILETNVDFTYVGSKKK